MTRRAVNLLVASLVAFAISSISITNAANTILNPSFENCLTTPLPSVTAPSDWFQSASGNALNPTVRCTTDYFHTGNSSAQFTPQTVTLINTGSADYLASFVQDFEVSQAGQQLTLTYWVLWGAVPLRVAPSSHGTFAFRTFFDDGSGNATEIVTTYVDGTSTEANNWFYQYRGTFTPPSAGTISLSFVAVNNAIYIYIDDVSISTAVIVGDPQFVGLRGQSYQVHGIDGEVYNLITSNDTQVNSQFVFLRSGACPVFNGTRDKNCWSHPGSYLGAIGVQQFVDGQLHQLSIVSGSATQGFASIVLNGTPMSVGDSFSVDDAFYVHRTSTHQIIVRTPEFAFVFDNSDMFINQAVTPRVFVGTLTCHGLFGQTHQNILYRTALKYIEGVVDDYRLEERSLFGKDFVYNRFNH